MQNLGCLPNLNLHDWGLNTFTSIRKSSRYFQTSEGKARGIKLLIVNSSKRHQSSTHNQTIIWKFLHIHSEMIYYYRGKPKKLTFHIHIMRSTTVHLEEATKVPYPMMLIKLYFKQGKARWCLQQLHNYDYQIKIMHKITCRLVCILLMLRVRAFPKTIKTTHLCKITMINADISLKQIICIAIMWFKKIVDTFFFNIFMQAITTIFLSICTQLPPHEIQITKWFELCNMHAKPVRMQTSQRSLHPSPIPIFKAEDPCLLPLHKISPALVELFIGQPKSKKVPTTTI